MATANTTSIAETWKPVVEFEGLYEVSDHGRVRAIRRSGSRGSILQQSITAKGYYRASLNKRNKGFFIFVHRLVLDAFVGIRPHGLQCRHLDGNPGNNMLVNLQWGSVQDNIADKRAHGTMCIGDHNGQAKLSAAQVVEIRALATGGMSHGHIAAMYGVSRNTIRAAVTRTTWAHVA